MRQGRNTRWVQFCGAALALCVSASAGEIRPRPLLRDFLGLNGHTVNFKPELYRPVARLARDYHPVSWDLGEDSSRLPDFPFARNQVNWATVYGAWQKGGWEIDASLQVELIPLKDWKDPERDAHAYGKAFAREFGPSGKRALVNSAEIGNEPGKWASDEEFLPFYVAMARGLREGDPKMKVVTPSLTLGASGDYHRTAALFAQHPELVDVLNLHVYAELEGWPTWRRSFPEDPALPDYLKTISDMAAWRDAKMPGTPIWITEFGYDSTTQPQQSEGTFSHWIGVSDTEQAQWLVRSVLMFASLPVERAYVFYYDDQDEAQLHASSGITRKGKPKPAFHALAHLQKTLGDFRFSKVVREEAGNLRVQEHVSEEGARRIWVAWVPTRAREEHKLTLEGLPGRLVSATRMPLGPGPMGESAARDLGNGSVEVVVSGSPVYLMFEP